jgi:hypothetical protein
LWQPFSFHHFPLASPALASGFSWESSSISISVEELSPMKPRFSIRDLLWLTVVIACLTMLVIWVVKSVKVFPRSSPYPRTSTVIDPSNSLQASDAELRAGLLQKTPLQSSLLEVEAAVTNEGWRFIQQPDGLHQPAGKAFGGNLSEYQSFPSTILVTAVWLFDSNDRLIDIQVRRSKIGL